MYMITPNMVFLPILRSISAICTVWKGPGLINVLLHDANSLHRCSVFICWCLQCRDRHKALLEGYADKWCELFYKGELPSLILRRFCFCCLCVTGSFLKLNIWRINYIYIIATYRFMYAFIFLRLCNLSVT